MPTTNPVPSTDPSDLLFNAGKLDEVVNGTANSFTDRLGVTRRTIGGIDAEAETRMDAIDAAAIAQRDNIQDAADLVLAAAGYAPPVAYAAGISLTLQTQTVSYNGEVYAPKVANLPFTTSGTFETGKFRLIQGVASADLPALVGQDLQDYAALRSYIGLAKRIYITGLLATAKPDGISGFFQHDQTDTTSADNGGTIIVGADGRRWKRDYTGNVNAKWFGAKGDGLTVGTDNTAAILLAIAEMGNTGTLDFDPGVYLTDPLDLRACRNFTLRGANEATPGPWLSSNSTIIKIRSAGDVGIKTATVDEMPIANYGKNIKIKNLYLDCNHFVTTGINCLQGTSIEGVEVRYAQQDGIVLEQTSYPVNIRDTVSAQNGRDGLRAKPQFTTSYQLTNVECRQNGGNGFTIHAGFTSIFTNCLAQSNTGDGFVVELFDPVASGYTFPVYLAGIVFISCYSEANGGWGFRTNSYNNNPAAYAGKIDNLTFISCGFNSGIGQRVKLRGLSNINITSSQYLSDAYDPLYNTVAIDNVIVHGSITPKYEVDLTTSTAGKIRFPSVQIPSSDPNVLDDYEEGTFTARISQQQVSYFTTSGTTTARYQKIGNVVTCFIDYSWSDKGSAGAGFRAILDELPYSASTFGVSSASPCSIKVSGGSTDHWMIWVQSSTKTAYFVKNNATGAGAVISDLPAAGTLTATFSYVASA